MHHAANGSWKGQTLARTNDWVGEFAAEQRKPCCSAFQDFRKGRFWKEICVQRTETHLGIQMPARVLLSQFYGVQTGGMDPEIENRGHKSQKWGHFPTVGHEAEAWARQLARWLKEGSENKTNHFIPKSLFRSPITAEPGLLLSAVFASLQTIMLWLTGLPAHEEARSFSPLPLCGEGRQMRLFQQLLHSLHQTQGAWRNVTSEKIIKTGLILQFTPGLQMWKSLQ